MRRHTGKPNTGRPTTQGDNEEKNESDLKNAHQIGTLIT